MLVGGAGANGIGEWGFAAVLEADGRRILIDTGARAETVLKNVSGADASTCRTSPTWCSRTITAITPAGCITLRREFMKKNPRRAVARPRAAGDFPEPSNTQWRRDQWPDADQSRVRKIRRAVCRARRAVRIVAGRVDARTGAARASGAEFRRTRRQWFAADAGRANRGQRPGRHRGGRQHAKRTGRDQRLRTRRHHQHPGVREEDRFATCRWKRPSAASTCSPPRTRCLSGPAGRLRALGVRHLLGAHCTGIEAVFQIAAAAPGSRVRPPSSVPSGRRSRSAPVSHHRRSRGNSATAEDRRV